MLGGRRVAMVDSSQDDGDRIPPLTGLLYLPALSALHDLLQPRAYLEIGVAEGETLRLARCASIAIDPEMHVAQDVVGVKPSCLLFQTTSDAFFAQHDPVRLLHRPIDFAFLDGMHWYEYLLRDFANTERCCEPNSVIALHDCVPTDIYMTRRDRWDETQQRLAPSPGSWTGDVWKTLLLLRRYRPDLEIHCFDSDGTGLVLITHLNPASQVITTNYDAMVAEIASLSLREYGLRRYIVELRLEDASLLTRPQDVASRFRLGGRAVGAI
jgi:predicted O-methyltransferase YrrM